MAMESGRSPLRGSGHLPSGLSQSSLSQAQPSVPNADAWRTDSPPFGKRPIWQYIWVQGEKYHSGTTWFRQGWGTAAIRTNDAEDGFQGYRRSDIERICRDNDIEPCSADVVGWLPMTPPALLRDETRPRLAPSDDGEYAREAVEQSIAALAKDRLSALPGDK
jgi:hypothetical protein